MKFRAHDTFAIRKGWLHKGMRHVVNNPRIFVDKDINPMDEFGIGANMVKALRYWLQATGLTEENTGNNRNQYLSPFGEEVWANDPYLEEDGTLLLIHYFLASNEKMATAWYYFFNHNYVTSCPDKTSYFGGVTAALHNTLVNDPKPYRKEVKDLLANTLGWIKALDINEIAIDTPNHSQRIRIVN